MLKTSQVLLFVIALCKNWSVINLYNNYQNKNSGSNVDNVTGSGGVLEEEFWPFAEKMITDPDKQVADGQTIFFRIQLNLCKIQ